MHSRLSRPRYTAARNQNPRAHAHNDPATSRRVARSSSTSAAGNGRLKVQPREIVGKLRTLFPPNTKVAKVPEIPCFRAALPPPPPHRRSLLVTKIAKN